MKILLLLGTFNYPPRNGGDQALINAIDKLNHFVDFHLISVAESEKQRMNLESFKRAYPNIPSTSYVIDSQNNYRLISKFFRRLSNAINRRNGNEEEVNLQSTSIYEPQFSQLNDFYYYIDSYINENGIDIVQSEFWFTLGRLTGITSSVKRVFVQHEIQYVVNAQRLYQQSYNIADFKHLEAMRRSEINAMNACDAIITLSKDDKIRLLNDGVHTPIFDSFAQIKFKDFVLNNKPINCRRLVFIGPESHVPNRHGVEWFLKEVWPLILNKHTDTCLDIIGNWSDVTINDWSSSFTNIRFLGFVDNLEQALESSILIVPIFQGSGIRMKILEACNLGVPVASSTIGAEGLGLTDGVNAFITDDPITFANDILLLLDSPDVATRLVMEANKHIINDFSNQKFIESRMKCYKFLCGTE